MNSRSISLSTAALLLLSAAAPLQVGFAPTQAHAQQPGGEAARQAEKAERRAERANRKAEKEAEKAERRAERANRKAEKEAEKAERQADKAERRARRDAEKAERRPERAERRPERAERRPERAERRPERAERRPERAEQRPERAEQRPERAEQRPERAEQRPERAERRPERAERRPERAERRERQPEAQEPARQARPSDALTPETIAALRDSRPASEVAQPELRRRIELLGAAMDSGVLSRDQRQQVQARIDADRQVVRARREANQNAKAERQGERRQRRATGEEIPQAEVGRRARDIIADDTAAADLDDGALRKRLTENRAILGTGKLSKAEERHLRQQLRQDRVELRDRVARRQAAAEEPSSRSRSRTRTDPDAAIDQRSSADNLSDRDLQRRVRAMNRDLREERLARRDAEIAREMVERDRRELRRRLHNERDRRRERRREARARNELVIDFDLGRNAGYRAPPVIFAAEAMPRDIEMQLVAPPVRQVSRSYSVAEISQDHEVRETMPGIEVDTLNFDFGSAEVRPEEIDKLDDIAYVIEGIVAARPDEVFLIEGHTDAVGSDPANDALSQRRAYAVMEALLDYYAIAPENLQTVGLGERFLKIWTEEPEEENRRVTIRRITPLLVGARG